MKLPNWCRQVACISWRKAVTADSGVAWVLAVGGQGLDLGDWQVNGAGGGDRRQGPAVSVGSGVGGRVGHLDRQRRRTTQMRTGPVEGDRARTLPLRHTGVPGNTEPLTRRPPIRSRQLQPRRRRRHRHRRATGRGSSLNTRRSLTRGPHPRIHPHQRRTPITDLRIRLHRRRRNLHRLPSNFCQPCRRNIWRRR